MEQQQKTRRFTREALLRSGRYPGIQQDFLAAVLCEPEYTLEQADHAVQAFFGPLPKDKEA